MSQAFPAQARIKTAEEFSRVRQSGLTMRGPYFRVGFLQSNKRRLGLVLSKQVGPAVTRNRLKRRSREHFRKHASLYPCGDFVLIPQSKAAELACKDYFAALEKMLVKLKSELGEA